MTAARKIEAFKPGYDGPRPSPLLTLPEREALARHSELFSQRLHTAMLTLGALSAHKLGGGSSMPEYIHEFSDKVGWDPDETPAPMRFRPTQAEIDDLLPTLQLLDGLSPVFLKVLALRAVGLRIGGFSYAVIGERFGRPEAWAQRVHQATVVIAARRAGLLDPAPKGWAVVVVAVQMGGWKSYLTTARDPRAALHDVRSKSPVELDRAFAFWTAGKAEAAHLAQLARKNLIGRVMHGSWHHLPPEDMLDLLATEQTRVERPWDLEALTLPRPRRTAAGALRTMVASAAGET